MKIWKTAIKTRHGSAGYWHLLLTLLVSSRDIRTEALAVNSKHIHKDFHRFHDYWFILKHHLLSKKNLKLDVKQYKIKLNQHKIMYQLHKFRIYKNLFIKKYFLHIICIYSSLQLLFPPFISLNVLFISRCHQVVQNSSFRTQV